LTAIFGDLVQDYGHGGLLSRVHGVHLRLAARGPSVGKKYLKKWRGKVQRLVAAPIVPLLAFARPVM
jgi:hypothetical protein